MIAIKDVKERTDKCKLCGHEFELGETGYYTDKIVCSKCIKGAPKVATKSKPQKVKRKRRTKVEMEAAKQAETTENQEESNEISENLDETEDS